MNRGDTPISRRVFGVSLTALAALPVLAACGGGTDTPATTAPRTAAPERIAYGGDPSQFGEFTFPVGPGAVRGLVVVIHGGFWQDSYGLELGRPLAAELVKAGWATWNIEYRRIGNGGGWTSTFDDAALALDHVRSFASVRLDLRRVYALGHSAGGHLAAWLAARPGLPPGAPGAGPAVRLAGVVSQAGVLDLIGGAGLGGGAVVDLVGGTPASAPDRYKIASPVERVPTRVRTICVHGTADDTVPFSQSETYVRRATAAGDPAQLVPVPGAGHLDMIDVRTPAWKASVSALDRVSA